MDLNVHLVFLVIFVIFEIIYIRIARLYQIVDVPNKRSSHSMPTIRGGGIVVLLSILLYFSWPAAEVFSLYLLTSIFMVAIISFIDDIKSLPTRLRMVVHLIAVSLLFIELNIFNSYSVLFVAFWYLLVIGYLNIYNFMDGINGITFLNALASYITFLIINVYVVEFTDSNFLIALILAVIVFGFFNFRIRPVCFAGDVGSITIGFSIIYFSMRLYLETNNLFVLLILASYALDGGWTLIERLYRRKNIFQAHREHLYQALVSDKKSSHLIVSSGYFIFQLLVNTIVVMVIDYGFSDILTLLIIFLGLSGIYLLVKRKAIHHKRSLAE